MKKGIIFDLDGTLLDSMKIWKTIGSDYLIAQGIMPRENLAEVFKEMSLAQSAAYYQTHYGLEKSEREIIAEINAMIEQFYLEEAELKTGVREFLERLHACGVKMCIATATDRYLVEGALKRCGVEAYLGQIFTCAEVGYGKDRPDIYEKALEFLGTKKEETLVFEDALHAIRTAKKAGFQVAAVWDESETEQERVREISDYYIRFEDRKAGFYENSFIDCGE